MEELRPAAAQRIERGMRQRRLAHRRGLVEKREDSLDWLPGRWMNGRDSKGEIVRTKEPRAFKVQMLGDGIICMSTGLKKSKAGSKTLPGTPTRTTVTDIFYAVRNASHIEESEEADIGGREVLLREIEGLNSDLAAANAALPDESIRRIAGLLRSEVLGMLNEKDAETLSYLPENDPLADSISKEMFRFKSELKIDAGAQLAKAESTLLGALRTSNASAKARIAINVCTQLQAFLNRFGKWRDEEAEGIKGYNFYRECSLRAERDLRLEELLEKWALDLRGQNPWAVINLWKKDLAHAEKIEKFSAELRKSGWREGLESLGKELKSKGYDNKWGRYSVVERLRDAYSILRDSEREKGAWEEGKKEAREILEDAARVLKSDKPAYVLAQLEESGPEEYLVGDGKKTVYSYLSKGVELLGKRVPDGALRCFEGAHRKLQELNREL